MNCLLCLINPTFATACLPSDDFKIVAPYLEATKLDRDYMLILPNIPIEYVNFVEKGMVFGRCSEGRRP